MPDPRTDSFCIRVADTAWRRLVGLLGGKALANNEGVWLYPCRAVHTFGMRFAIDVVFVDDKHQVIRLVSNLAPGRVAWCWSATSVIELAAGAMSRPGAKDMLERTIKNRHLAK